MENKESTYYDCQISSHFHERMTRTINLCPLCNFSRNNNLEANPKTWQFVWIVSAKSVDNFVIVFVEIYLSDVSSPVVYGSNPVKL